MTISIPQVNTAPSASTFTDLFSGYNQMANAMSSVVLTAASTANGASVTGNSSVLGIFSATIIATSTIRGGNVTNTGPIAILSDVVANGQILVGNSTANTIINSSAIAVNNMSVSNLVVTNLSLGTSLGFGNGDVTYVAKTVNAAGSTVVDSWALNLYRACDYIFSIKDLAANVVQTSKLSTLTDGASAFSDEYSILYSNNIIGSFTASANATSFILSFVSTANSCSVKAIRTGIKQ